MVPFWQWQWVIWIFFYLSFFLSLANYTKDHWHWILGQHYQVYTQMTAWQDRKGQSLSAAGKVVGECGSSWGDVCTEIRDSFIRVEVLMDTWSLRLASWAQAYQRTINHQTQAAILGMSVQLVHRTTHPSRSPVGSWNDTLLPLSRSMWQPLCWAGIESFPQISPEPRTMSFFLTCENWAKLRSENKGTCPNSSWQMSLKQRTQHSVEGPVKPT